MVITQIHVKLKMNRQHGTQLNTESFTFIFKTLLQIFAVTVFIFLTKKIFPYYICRHEYNVPQQFQMPCCNGYCLLQLVFNTATSGCFDQCSVFNTNRSTNAIQRGPLDM
jgi:hypothetical protein